VTQPVLFAVEVALFRLVESFGLVPDVVMGHSVGELAAAYVAGVLSLGDAVRLVVARGRLMEALPEGGVMVAVEASEDEVASLLTSGVSLAAVNGPRAVVVAGVEAEAAVVGEHFVGLGRRVRRLRVSHAFHSPLMEPMLEEFGAVAESVEYRAPRIAVVSNVSGRVAEGDELVSARYWVEHVRRPVRFLDGVGALAGLGVSRVVELGPSGVLTAMARDCLPEGDTTVLVPVLRKDRSEPESVIAALSELHVDGLDVDWSPLVAGGRRTALPTYAFQHQRYWLEPRTNTANAPDLGLTSADHPLLGAAVGLAAGEGVLLTGRVSIASHAWVADYPAHGRFVVPGSAFLELALRAGDEVGCGTVDELTVDSPLVVPEQGAVNLQLMVGEADDTGRRAFTVHARAATATPDTQWDKHAHGTLSAVVTPVPIGRPDLTVWPPVGAVESPRAPIPGLRAVWRRDGEVFAEVVLSDSGNADATAYGLHPALLQAVAQAVTSTSTSTGEQPFALTGLRGVRLAARGAQLAVITGRDARRHSPRRTGFG